MPIIDCVPVICGGCGAGIWVVAEYAIEPLCWACKEKLGVGADHSLANKAHTPSMPSDDLIKD